ncbi:hypothetical protein EV356DRAFT_535109 [Viridothelium virens]|uniref:Myb-like domain-containing protein n=1 Tax=Viridothelium virens TaxID=1048519 RepID=A0A6A6H1P7_VIRVR|nr:hypothetical protein EV356DRAFT_535109 [Viridothelium virens]
MSFINKSTKKVAPKLPAIRRRPGPTQATQSTPESSRRSSTEPQPSPAQSQAPLAHALSVQEQDAPPTPPPSQSQASEPIQTGIGLVNSNFASTNGPEHVQGSKEAWSSTIPASLSPRTQLEGHEEPPSKRRKTTPPTKQIIQEVPNAEVQEESIDRRTQPVESELEHTQETNELPSTSSLVPKPHRASGSLAGVPATDRTEEISSQITEEQSQNADAQVQERQPSLAGRRKACKAKQPVQSIPKPPLRPPSPPSGGIIMRTIEGPEEPLPARKPRKVRKDKGTKRKNKQQMRGTGLDEIQDDRRAELSNPIEGMAASTGARSTQQAEVAGVNTQEDHGEIRQPSGTESATPIQRSHKVKHRSRTSQTSSTPAASNEFATTPSGTTRRRKRQRRETPPENEHVEITPSITTMHDLCKDTRTGQKSSKEKRLQARDLAKRKIKQQVAQDHLRSLSSVGRGVRDRQHSASLDVPHEDGIRDSSDRVAVNHEENVHQGPMLRIVDGVIQLDETSLQIDRHAASNDVLDPSTAPIEEDDLSQRLTAHSWLYTTRRDPEDRLPRAHKSDPWDPDETRVFYEALRMFGTDFGIIAAMFAGRNRRQIKAKFTREERENPDLLDEALGVQGRVPMSLEQYAQATGRDIGEGGGEGEGTEEGWGFVDPVKLREELAEQEQEAMKKIEEKRKEAAEERKQREAARLHLSGKVANGDGSTNGANKENEGDKKKKRKRKEKEMGSSGKKRKHMPQVVAGGEEVVIESIE